MLTRKMVRFSAVALVGFACVLATEARAQLSNGQAQTALLTCTAPLAFSNESVTVAAVPMGNPATFPHDVPCPSPATGTCSEYNYTFTSSNGSNLTKAYLSLSSDLNIYEVFPSAFIENPVCEGDGNLIGRFVCEQRQVRFNSQPSGFNARVVVTRSAPRVSTGGAIVGLLQAGFCLIQGPGVPGGAFTSVSLSTSEQVAGGKCVADWSFNPAGIVTGVSTTTPGCTAGVGVVTANLPNDSTELLQDSGGATVTSGVNTSSCKTVAGKSYCVCTRAPCP